MAVELTAMRMFSDDALFRTEADDPDTGGTVPLFNPRGQQWADHFAWSVDGTRIIGLSSVGRATIAALHTNHPIIVAARSLWVDAGYHPPQ